MSCGLCPVVTNVGGNAAVLGDELKHRLVPAADPEALALALADTICNPDELRRDAGTARQRVVRQFGLDAMVSSYETLYSRAIGPAGARRG